MRSSARRPMRKLLGARLAGLGTEVLAGQAALDDVAALDVVDTVMAAIVGAAGLSPTLAAVRAGKKVLLANKEALVMSGAVFMAEVSRSRHAAAAHRQRTQRRVPVNAARLRRQPGRCGVRRFCSPPPAGPSARRWSACGGDAGTGLRPSELGDGTQDARWIPPP